MSVKKQKYFLTILLLSILIVLLMDFSSSAKSTKISSLNSILSKQNIELSHKINSGELRVYFKALIDHSEKDGLYNNLKVILKQVNNLTISGEYPQAILLIKKAIKLDIKDTKVNGFLWEKLGNLLYKSSKYSEASIAYKRSLDFNKSLTCLNNIVKNQNELLQQAQIKLEDYQKITKSKEAKEYQTVIDNLYKEMRGFAEQARQLGQQDSSLSSVYALTNWHSVFNEDLSTQEISRATDILNSQPSSKPLVLTIIKFSDADPKNSLKWLKKAESMALEINDPLLNSELFLKLGYFYEKREDYTEALKYSQKSQLIAQSNFSYNYLFRSQWLTGKIYNFQNNRDASIIAYQSAIASLDILKSSQKPSYRFSLSREIKPIYYELITLLLEQKVVKSQDILQALVIADKLKLSELQNFFGDDCFQIVNSATAKQNNSAVFSSIILEDKTYLVLQFPDNSIFFRKVEMSRSDLLELGLKFRNNLVRTETFDYRHQAEELYDLLIRPFEAQLRLAEGKFEVLTFVHDGVLRNLPMSALFDGQDSKYLVEKWPSVSSIGINFTPRIKSPSKLNALVFGLLDSQEPGWSTLSKVSEEADSVLQLIGGKKYLNQDFSIDNLSKQLGKNNYSVVHLATHGYFSGNPEDSFLLAYDGRIFIPDLEEYLSQQTVIDLLVLSACETSVSSDRSLLGLAGVASRSGVKSTLGSFWKVLDDEQSELIQQFYAHWQRDKFNKATALQKVQQEQIANFAHPNKWAALNLIGSYD